jgi:cbb3-type cytochrome oxidase subunit 3
MIKDLVYALGYSFFGNLSLLMFLTIFIAVSVYVLRTSRADSTRNANVVLDDLESEGI